MDKGTKKLGGLVQPGAGKPGEPTTPKPQLSTSRRSQYRAKAEATMLMVASLKRTGMSRRLQRAMTLQLSNAAATIGPNRWNSKAR
jgi:hypothetical protein